MSNLMKQLLIPASRRLQHGTMGMFVPKESYSTEATPEPSPSGTPVKTKVQSNAPAYPWNIQCRYVWWESAKNATPVLTDPEEIKIKKLFTAYDKNHDGWISRGEWYDVVFKFLGDKDSAWILAEKIMDDLDIDPKDEKVTFSEFRAGMKSQWHLFRPKIDKVQV